MARDAAIAASLECLVCGDVADDARDGDDGGAVASTSTSLSASQFVSCANGHALCETCFSTHVMTESTKAIADLKVRKGEVFCVRASEAFKDAKCDAKCFGARVIAARCDDATFTAYQSARDKVKEEDLVKSAEEKMLKERERLEKETAAETKLREAREHVIEEIFTLRCPNELCKQAFVDFSGCMALTCSRCRTGFCAYCLKHCGHDAHAHIGHCKLAKEMVELEKKKAKSNVALTNRGHPPGTFANFSIFTASQRLRRLRAFAAYAKDWDDAWLTTVIDAIEVEMRDLQLTKDDVLSARKELANPKPEPKPKPAPKAAAPPRAAAPRRVVPPRAAAPPRVVAPAPRMVNAPRGHVPRELLRLIEIREREDRENKIRIERAQREMSDMVYLPNKVLLKKKVAGASGQPRQVVEPDDSEVVKRVLMESKKTAAAEQKKREQAVKLEQKLESLENAVAGPSRQVKNAEVVSLLDDSPPERPRPAKKMKVQVNKANTVAVDVVDLT